MNKWLAVSVALSLILSINLAFAGQFSNARIDYTDYKEIMPGDTSVIFKVKITNTGKQPATYELYPDSDAVKAIGTYRIDPSFKATLKGGEEQTFLINIMLEKEVTSRVAIPLHIISGNQTQTVELAARQISIAPTQKNSDWIQKVLKIAFYTLVVLILISLIVNIFRRARKKKKEGDNEEPEVETYY